MKCCCGCWFIPAFLEHIYFIFFYSFMTQERAVKVAQQQLNKGKWSVNSWFNSLSLVRLPLAEITWSHSFLCDLISLSHHRGWILAHIPCVVLGSKMNPRWMANKYMVIPRKTQGLNHYFHSLKFAGIHLCIALSNFDSKTASHLTPRLCTEMFVVDWVTVRYPVTVKQAQIIPPTPPCSTVGIILC